MDTGNSTGTDPDLVAGRPEDDKAADDNEPTADTASGGAPEEPDTSPASYGFPDGEKNSSE